MWNIQAHPWPPTVLRCFNKTISSLFTLSRLKGLCCLHTDVCRVVLLLSGWESIANSLVVSFPVGPHAIVLQRCMCVWSLMCNRYTAVCSMQHVIGRVDHTWRQNNPWRGRSFVMTTSSWQGGHISCCDNICKPHLLLLWILMQCRFTGGRVGPIPVDTGWQACFTPDRSPFNMLIHEHDAT